jgi:hypothetical protein
VTEIGESPASFCSGKMNKKEFNLMTDADNKEVEIVLEFGEELPTSSDDFSIQILSPEPSLSEEEDLTSLIDEVSNLEREFESEKRDRD